MRVWLKGRLAQAGPGTDAAARSRLVTLLLALILTLPLVLGLATPTVAETRVALVIGINSYQNAPPLTNPMNDARAIGDALRRLNFDVEELVDPDYRALTRGIRNFGVRAQKAETALVYYAGHGVQVDRENYLIPADAKLERARDLAYEALPVSLMLDEVAQASKIGIVLLDSCRNNPFIDRVARAMTVVGRAVATTPGMARVDNVPRNTMVVMAAKSDQIAEDGQDHSPFAAAVLAHFQIPGLELGLFFRSVRDAVLKATQNRQEPYVFSSLGADPFYFYPRPPNRPPIIGPIPILQVVDTAGPTRFGFPTPTDPDLDPLSVRIIGMPRSGEVRVEGRKVTLGEAFSVDHFMTGTFKPDGTMFGPIGTLDILVEDGRGGSVTGSLPVVVLPSTQTQVAVAPRPPQPAPQAPGTILSGPEQRLAKPNTPGVTSAPPAPPPPAPAPPAPPPPAPASPTPPPAVTSSGPPAPAPPSLAGSSLPGSSGTRTSPDQNPPTSPAQPSPAPPLLAAPFGQAPKLAPPTTLQPAPTETRPAPGGAIPAADAVTPAAPTPLTPAPPTVAFQSFAGSPIPGTSSVGPSPAQPSTNPLPVSPFGLAEARALALRVPCALIDVREAQAPHQPTRLLVSGPMLPGTAFDSFMRRIEAPNRSVGIATEPLDPGHCAALAVVTDLVRHTRERGALRLTAPTTPVPIGGQIAIAAETFPNGALYIDLHAADGTVQHLRRGVVQGNPAEFDVTVAAAASGPPGQRLLVAIATATPLDLGQRSANDTEAAYLPALQHELARVGAGSAKIRAEVATLSVIAASRPVAVSARPPLLPSPQSRPPNSTNPRCQDIVARVILGETLSDADRALLRGSCGR